MLDDYLKRIINARVYDIARETPLERATALSEKLANNVYLKREDLQPVYSFKLRGAFNKLSRLTAEQLRSGVIAASAGNHAQGLSLGGSRLGIRPLIVMPKTTPPIKVSAVRSYGARTVLNGDTYDDAYEHAHNLAAEKGYTFIHPYDDIDVIAGQGTIANEILRALHEPIHAIFVPVGGGGLIAGIAAFVKAVRPEIEVIGVEPEDAACLAAALQCQRRVVLSQVGLFADGVAVRQVGKEPWRVLRQTVSRVITVTSDEICASIKDIFDNTRSIVEPAGALAVAGLKKYCHEEGIEDQNLVAINSGANINFDRLRHVAERAELGERREALFAVTIPERPGSFKRFCKAIGQRSITEFNYRFADPEHAHVFAGIQLADGEPERESLMQMLIDEGYPVVDMTDNELAKLHMRHMVGGRSAIDNERIFRFEFPERPGALLRFLNMIGHKWNISLFHYRNHGAAYGRVLVGVQIEHSEDGKFIDYLNESGYSWQEESDNPIYHLFL